MHSHSWACLKILLVTHNAIAFGHKRELATGYVVHLHRFPHNSFRFSVRVNICSIPLLLYKRGTSSHIHNETIDLRCWYPYRTHISATAGPNYHCYYLASCNVIYFPSRPTVLWLRYKPLSHSIPMETIASFQPVVLLESGWILSIHFFPPDEILLSLPGLIFSTTQGQWQTLPLMTWPFSTQPKKKDCCHFVGRQLSYV